MYLRVSPRICTYLRVSARICTYLRVAARICVCLRVSARVAARICARMCVSARICARMRVSARMFIFITDDIYCHPLFWCVLVGLSNGYDFIVLPLCFQPPGGPKSNVANNVLTHCVLTVVSL